MLTQTQNELNAETYRALGLFVVRFSHLMHALETSTMYLLEIFGHPSRGLVEAALANRTAEPITSAFFSVFFKRWKDDLDAREENLVSKVRNEIQELIQTRNRLMHDVWLYSHVGGDDSAQELSRHRLRTHGKGADYESIKYSPADIENFATDARRLAEIVNGMAWYNNPEKPGPNISSRFSLVDGRVKRLD